MRAVNRVLAGTAALGLATSLAACGSSDASPKPVGSFKTLTGKTTTVVPDSGFTSALASLKVKLGLVGNAMMTSEGVAFPITGGNATIYPYKSNVSGGYVQGTIDHQGSGISLTAGSKTVNLTNFVIDPGSNSKLTGDVALNGKSVKTGIKLFDLDGSTLQKPTIKNGVATLKGTTIYLSSGAADLLNQTFGVSALKGGVPNGTKIGTAIVRATGS